MADAAAVPGAHELAVGIDRVAVGGLDALGRVAAEGTAAFVADAAAVWKAHGHGVFVKDVVAKVEAKVKLIVEAARAADALLVMVTDELAVGVVIHHLLTPRLIHGRHCAIRNAAVSGGADLLVWARTPPVSRT